MLQRLLLISEAEAAGEVAAPTLLLLLLLLLLLGSNEGEEEAAVVVAAVGTAEILSQSMSSLLSLPLLLILEAEEAGAEALPPRADCSKIGRSYCRSHHYQLSYSHPVHLPAYASVGSAASAVGSGVHNCHNIRHNPPHTRDLHTSNHPPPLPPRRRCSRASRPRRSPRR